MSISFACPECKVQIEVADEHAGQSGQCPRCQNVMIIPSGKQPLPTMAGAAPAADPWAKPRDGFPRNCARNTPTCLGATLSACAIA